MIKMADNYYRYEKTSKVGDCASAHYVIDRIDWKDLDTAATVDIRFCLTASRIGEFEDRLARLIEEFRI